jgi:prepilin signal peptidase PulO-like enzyme (type II secretory pathway)
MIFIKNMNLIFILPFVAIQFLLLILSLWDIKQKEVPVPTLYCLFLMCVVMAVTNPYCRIINNLVVGGVLSVALFILYKVASDKIGLGDVEIMLALGFAFGYPQIFSIIFSSLFLSMVFGILLMTVKKAKLKTTIPFVPFLFIGMTLNIINY